MSSAPLFLNKQKRLKIQRARQFKDGKTGDPWQIKLKREQEAVLGEPGRSYPNAYSSFRKQEDQGPEPRMRVGSGERDGSNSLERGTNGRLGSVLDCQPTEGRYFPGRKALGSFTLPGRAQRSISTVPVLSIE